MRRRRENNLPIHGTNYGIYAVQRAPSIMIHHVQKVSKIGGGDSPAHPAGPTSFPLSLLSSRGIHDSRLGRGREGRGGGRGEGLKLTLRGLTPSWGRSSHQLVASLISALSVHCPVSHCLTLAPSCRDSDRYFSPRPTPSHPIASLSMLLYLFLVCKHFRAVWVCVP